MKKKIKVAIVINDFMVGGAQKLIVDTLHHYNRHEFDMTLITLFEFPGRNTFYDVLPADVTVHRLKFKNARDWRNWINLIKVVKHIQPDTVVSHLFFSNCIMRILKLLFKYTSITVEHNTYIHKSKLDIVIDKILSYVTYKIVAVSNTVKDFASRQQHIPLDKFIIIYNGIDLGKVSIHIADTTARIRRELRLDSQKIFINVARLTTQKNHQLLIQAFNMFAKNNPDAVLLILGEGALRAKLEQQIRDLGAESYIRLLGGRADVYDFYTQASAFVSTSVIEGLSIAYLESLAFGVPILATKTAGTDEIIVDGYNGYFVESNVQSVLIGLQRMYDSALKLTSGALASAAQYDIVATVAQYEKVIVDSLQR